MCLKPRQRQDFLTPCEGIAEQIVPKNHIVHVAKAVMEWLKKKGVKRVISLAGINTNDPASEEVYGIAAGPEAKKTLQKYKINVIEDGITTGLTALMLLELKRHPEIEAYSILGNVRVGADYKAAASLVLKLDEILGLKIPVKPLLEESRETEKELLRQLGELKKTSSDMTKMENQTPMYT